MSEQKVLPNPLMPNKVAFRISDRELARIDRLAAKRNIKRSEFIREILQRAASADEPKAA